MRWAEAAAEKAEWAEAEAVGGGVVEAEVEAHRSYQTKTRTLVHLY